MKLTTDMLERDMKMIEADIIIIKKDMKSCIDTIYNHIINDTTPMMIQERIDALTSRNLVLQEAIAQYKAYKTILNHMEYDENK